MRWMTKELRYNRMEYLDCANVLNATLLAENYANYLDIDYDIPEEIFDTASTVCDRFTEALKLNR